MLLSLALVLTATVSSQGVTGSEIADGPGVCYLTKDVTYTDYENQEVSNTRKEWCWSITKLFKCDVVYKNWESVPVTKTRQITEKVCCEGYYLHDATCVAEQILNAETPISTPEPVKETSLWEVLLSSKGVAPESRVDITASNTVEEPEVATESSDSINAPAEVSDDDLTMENLELAHTLYKKYHPYSSSPVDDNGIVVTPVHDDNHDNDVNPEATEADVGGVVENASDDNVNTDGLELFHALFDKYHPVSSTVDDNGIVVNPVHDDNNDDEVHPEAVEAHVGDIIDNDTPTEAPAPAAGNEDEASAAEAESSAAAHNAANAEVMAAEAIGIFAKELLKPLEVLPASEAPSEIGDVVESHGELIKPLEDPAQEHPSASAIPDVAQAAGESEEEALPTVEKALLQTMMDLSEVFLRSLSRLHQAYSSIRRQSPRRESFQ